MRTCVLLALLALVGSGCGRPAAPPVSPRILVSALQDNALFVVDPGTNTVAEQPVPAPVGPAGMASRGPRAYLALLGRPYLQVLDLPGPTEAHRIPLGAGCNDVALSPDGSRLAATIPSSGEVLLISLPEGEPRHVALGGQPHAAAWSPDGSTLYVTNPGRGSLQRVGSDGTPGEETRLGLGPRGLSVDADRVVVALYDENSVVAVPAKGGGEPRRFVVGGGPYDLLPTGGGLLVSLSEDGALAALDLERGGSTKIPLGPGAAGMAITPDRQFVYVACEAAGEVVAVGLHDNSIVARIALPAGARPRECVFVSGASPGGQ